MHFLDNDNKTYPWFIVSLNKRNPPTFIMRGASFHLLNNYISRNHQVQTGGSRYSN